MVKESSQITAKSSIPLR